jgi:hypothetical protein
MALVERSQTALPSPRWSPHLVGSLDFKVLLLEKKRQGNQTALCARATRGLRSERRGSLAVLLLAERARSECARSTRAIEDRPGYPLKTKWENGKTRGVQGNLVTLLG